MSSKRTIRPQLALEMAMRDVLDNMEDFSSGFAFTEMAAEFEILGVEPVASNGSTRQQSTGPRIRAVLSAEVMQLPYPLKQAS